jgi:hypothetical protein
MADLLDAGGQPVEAPRGELSHGRTIIVQKMGFSIYDLTLH